MAVMLRWGQEDKKAFGDLPSNFQHIIKDQLQLLGCSTKEELKRISISKDHFIFCERKFVRGSEPREMLLCESKEDALLVFEENQQFSKGKHLLRARFYSGEYAALSLGQTESGGP